MGTNLGVVYMVNDFIDAISSSLGVRDNLQSTYGPGQSPESRHHALHHLCTHINTIDFMQLSNIY